MDLIIYASQLSQSFFSCLSNSVEGFLDLFLSDASNEDDEKIIEEDTVDATNRNDDMFRSLHITSQLNTPQLETNTILSNEIMTKIPAGAFASIFCNKVLGILSLQNSGTEEKRKKSVKDDKQ